MLLSWSSAAFLGPAARRLSSATRARARAASSSAWYGYVTDVEGDVAFWERYCRLSAVLDDSRGLDDLALLPGCHLVFGGDSVDKGGHDLAFLRSLLRLKERHPDRVHLLMGNRDINKMRLSAELAVGSEHWRPAARHPGVYWRQGATPATPATWLAAQRAPTADDAVSRLRWMLEDNMGSPRAFEGRRAELAAQGRAGRAVASVGDEEVLASYVASLAPGGVLRAYLEQAQLAALLGDTLFVHGGFTARTVGHVPGDGGDGGDGGEAAAGGAPPPVAEWVQRINRFAAEQVGAWAADCDGAGAPSWAGARDALGPGFFHRPGGALMAYAMARQPGGGASPTVVYSSFLADGHPRPAEPAVAAWLLGGGVRTLVVGHQPHGDAPVLMRCAAPAPAPAPAPAAVPPPELLVVTADTSFSNDVEWVTDPAPPPREGGAPPAGHQLALAATKAAAAAAAQAAAQAAAAAAANAPGSEKPRGRPPPPPVEPRGAAVAEVCGEIREIGAGAGAPARVRVHGTLSDGSALDFVVGDEPRVGTERGGWWVKGVLPGGELLLSRGKGYTVQNCRVPGGADGA